MTIKTKGKSCRDVFNDVLHEMAREKGFSADAFVASNHEFMEAIKIGESTPFQDFCSIMQVEPDRAISLMRRDIEKLIPAVQ